MDNWFPTYGRVIYDPDRGRMKSGTEWWCIIELENPEIADYYRWMIDRYWWDADSSPVKRSYVKSPHDPHVSLIRGEQPIKNQHLWGVYRANQRVRLWYNNDIRQTLLRGPEATDKFWFVEARWKFYLSMRRMFGLATEWEGRKYRPHLTVAQTHILTPTQA